MRASSASGAPEGRARATRRLPKRRRSARASSWPGCCGASGPTRRRRTWRAGDEVAARAAGPRPRAVCPRGDDRARLLAEIARSHERSGETDAAAERWREIWTRYATSPEAGAAEQALARFAAADAKLVYRTPAALRERCRGSRARSATRRRSPPATAAIAAAPGDRGLQRERADVLFRMRRYAEAVDAFRALGDDDRMAVFWRARSLARSGRIEESLATFARVSNGADAELAARARFLSATLLEDTRPRGRRGRLSRASSAPRRRPSQRSTASWRLAWLAWRRGDIAEAASGLERFSARRGRSRRAGARALLARAGLRASRPDAGARAAGADRERGALHLLRLARGRARRSGRTGRPRRGVGAGRGAGCARDAALLPPAHAAAHPDPARGRARRARRRGDPAARRRLGRRRHAARARAAAARGGALRSGPAARRRARRG